MNKEFSLKTSKGDFLSISTYGFENISTAPCLIFVHGFKGFKDWGFFPYSAKYFADKGYFVITFNFSHNGIGKIETEFTELEKFAENTISLEISELSQLVDAYFKLYFGNIIYGKLNIIGHSRGGGIALLTSLINDKIDSFIVWSSVCKFDRYTQRQKSEWRNLGFFEVLNSRTNQMMKMNVDLLEDIEKNKLSSLNIEKAVKNLNKNLLIVQGEQDLTVPLSEAKEIYQWSNKNLTELFVIPAVGHTFDIVHPFLKSNSKFDLVINRTEEFLNEKKIN